MKRMMRTLLEEMVRESTAKADRTFTWLLFFQWVLSVGLALMLTRLTWNGLTSSVHPHVYEAIFVGGLLALVPIMWIRLRPGHTMNSKIVAAAQIFFSTLLIEITGGRIETHFHVFVSLAFLTIYRAKGPIYVAAAITFLDHLIRGYFSPESVYGVAYANPLRAIEHGAWVLFESGVLLQIIHTSQQEMRDICETRARLEVALNASAKMSALGEFVSGVAHEINNPLTAVKSAVEQGEIRVKAGSFSGEDAERNLSMIKRNIVRIIKIVKSLKNISRAAQGDPMEAVRVHSIVDDVLEISRDSMKAMDIELRLDLEPGLEVDCRASEIAQVLVNLVGNARDAIASKDVRWVEISARSEAGSAVISVSDSGDGIPEDVLRHLMTPFFTTKPSGLGTGLGLTISRKVAESHGGSLEYDRTSPHTCFVLRLPLRQAHDRPEREVV